jgi:hypothetical protein
MTCRLHRMQKYKFGVTCLDTHLVGSGPGPTEHERVHRHFAPWTHLSTLHEPQIAVDVKYKLNVTCPNALFMGSTLGPPNHEK